MGNGPLLVGAQIRLERDTYWLGPSRAVVKVEDDEDQLDPFQVGFIDALHLQVLRNQRRVQWENVPPVVMVGQVPRRQGVGIAILLRKVSKWGLQAAN